MITKNGNSLINNISLISFGFKIFLSYKLVTNAIIHRLPLDLFLWKIQANEMICNSCLFLSSNHDDKNAERKARGLFSVSINNNSVSKVYETLTAGFVILNIGLICWLQQHIDVEF